MDGAHIINTATVIASPPTVGASDGADGADGADGSISAEDGDLVSWLLHPDISVGERRRVASRRHGMP